MPFDTFRNLRRQITATLVAVGISLIGGGGLLSFPASAKAPVAKTQLEKLSIPHFGGIVISVPIPVDLNSSAQSVTLYVPGGSVSVSPLPQGVPDELDAYQKKRFWPQDKATKRTRNNIGWTLWWVNETEGQPQNFLIAGRRKLHGRAFQCLGFSKSAKAQALIARVCNSLEEAPKKHVRAQSLADSDWGVFVIPERNMRLAVHLPLDGGQFRENTKGTRQLTFGLVDQLAFLAPQKSTDPKALDAAKRIARGEGRTIVEATKTARGWTLVAEKNADERQAVVLC